jgi:hypothetical protein
MAREYTGIGWPRLEHEDREDEPAQLGPETPPVSWAVDTDLSPEEWLPLGLLGIGVYVALVFGLFLAGNPGGEGLSVWLTAALWLAGAVAVAWRAAQAIAAAALVVWVLLYPARLLWRAWLRRTEREVPARLSVQGRRGTAGPG